MTKQYKSFTPSRPAPAPRIIKPSKMYGPNSRTFGSIKSGPSTPS